jgi:hypothetical protein
VTPNTKSFDYSPKVPAKRLVVLCQRLNARWKPVGSEYPSKYAISVIESVASERYSSAARFRASSRRASKEVPVCANRRCSVRGLYPDASLEVSPTRRGQRACNRRNALGE